jgi:glycosyltransferase involved in cell wall biosynthesis
MNKMLTNVTVFLEVFNEEARIGGFLENFKWADEVVVFDKESSDLTVSIALNYGATVITIPYSEKTGMAVKLIKSYQSSSDWYFFPTPSSLISPDLVAEVVKLTQDTKFIYDVIGLPLKFYVLGVASKRSPWDQPFKRNLIRKSVLELSSRIHHEYSYRSTKVWDITVKGDDDFYYHCTHSSPEEMFIKHARYVKNEEVVNSRTGMGFVIRSPFYEIIKSFHHVLIRKKTFLLGRKGIALGLAYISYYMMKYVSLWHQENIKSLQNYDELRIEFTRKWRIWDEKNQMNIEIK